MGEKRRDDEAQGARWIGKTNAAPERMRPADAEATENDVVEEPETYDAGGTSKRRPPEK
ncbi:MULTISPECIES: hypothetical protein [unclassified Streptomyces]|uniref:hypothetical protein n=1 Tax=unclassified Streptomyces TaxID=2593676 RepID=UPI00331AA740